MWVKSSKIPDIANTLRMIGEKGRDGFYKGSIAEAILKTSTEEGGVMTAADLADYPAGMGRADLDNLPRVDVCMRHHRTHKVLRRFRC